MFDAVPNSSASILATREICMSPRERWPPVQLGPASPPWHGARAWSRGCMMSEIMDVPFPRAASSPRISCSGRLARVRARPRRHARRAVCLCLLAAARCRAESSRRRAARPRREPEPLFARPPPPTSAPLALCARLLYLPHLDGALRLGTALFRHCGCSRCSRREFAATDSSARCSSGRRCCCLLQDRRRSTTRTATEKVLFCVNRNRTGGASC